MYTMYTMYTIQFIQCNTYHTNIVSGTFHRSSLYPEHIFPRFMSQVQDLEQTVQGLPYLRRSLPEEFQAAGQVNRLAAAAAGGVALPLAVGIMHPLDTVRTTMQATAGRGFSEAVKALGSKGVARGFGLSFAWASPQGAIRMASYETSKEGFGRKTRFPGSLTKLPLVLFSFTLWMMSLVRQICQ